MNINFMDEPTQVSENPFASEKWYSDLPLDKIFTTILWLYSDLFA